MFRSSCRVLAESLASKKAKMQAQINDLAEVVQLKKFRDDLRSPTLLDRAVPGSASTDGAAPLSLKSALQLHPGIVDAKSAGIVLDAALATFILHVESRITSMLGSAFYTIGPCGEELLAPIGLILRQDDPMALHYRHLSVSVARNLKKGETMESIMLNRARGYVVAATDPVTGGRHCALGGGSHDFIVTSTLASQTGPAVGRAICGPLAGRLGVKSPFAKDAVSFVSQGDGSVNNAHFLGAENLAEYVMFQNFKVPTVFCITDNGLSISLKNNGYIRRNLYKKLQIPLFWGKGNDTVSVWLAAHQAIEMARKTAKPTGLILTDITRRFGHAATDRQNAYLSADEIKRMANTNDIVPLCAQMVDAGLISQSALAEKFDAIHALCQAAFEKAHQEPKITSRDMAMTHLSAPLVPLSTTATATQDLLSPNAKVALAGITGAKAQVMRKHMNAVFDEALAAMPELLYIGEDVVHGGYYIVTENLAKKYPGRVFDFPPDEGALIGCGMGFAQGGFVPIVEIPYAKYLDCGMDMFTEAAIMSWLSCGKQSNGMVIRLQGFGRGVFGGNYHTHNMLHMPPGIDVICHSNGVNYARAMRYAIRQAKQGRVVMSVDCTELLNMREAAPGVPWEFALSAAGEEVSFDDVFVYKAASSAPADTVIVTYGNGIPASLQAQAVLLRESGVAVDVLECPLLSSVPKGLPEVIGKYRKAVFADPCKEGQHPLASHMVSLLNDGLLPSKSKSVTAARTYNPLGNTVTFLNCEDVVATVKALV